MSLHWNIGHDLRIFVLGPMSSVRAVDSSLRAIRSAVELLLKEPAAIERLKTLGATRCHVEIPDELEGALIAEDVFAKIDAADFIVVNISAKDKTDGRLSPNVFYELGLVHALGIPYVLVSREGDTTPFYFTGNRVHKVTDFEEPALLEALRQPLNTFLASPFGNTLQGNPITDFYRLPVVSISAAVGVASGYFENLVRRALLEHGFIGRPNAGFRHLIVCRPPNIMTHNFAEDFASLKALILRETGSELESKTLPMINDSDKRGLAGHFVKGIMIDLPTAAYTLKRSPRQKALELRLRQEGRTQATPESDRLLLQASEKLLDQFENYLQLLADNETEFRRSALTICSIRELPAKLKELLRQ